MKRFIVSVLCVATFFVGLGVLADKVGAKFKSDEKALEIVRKARVAIGGDAAIADVRSIVIKGQTTNTFKINGVERTETGEAEIALQLPDKLMKTIKIGKHDGANDGEEIVEKRHEVVVVGKNEGGEKVVLGDKDGEFTTADGKKFIFRKADGGEIEEINSGDKKIIVRKSGEGSATWTNEDGKNMRIEKIRTAGDHGAMRQNELLRTTLSLLLSAPEGINVEYTYGGESVVDGTTCEVVNAGFGGSTYKLFISRSTNLPVAMSYAGHRMPKIIKFDKELPPPADGAKNTVVFTRKPEGLGETAEFMVRFSDYRSTGGVQLPYKWTTTVGGAADEVFDVTSYEVNPANIADRFKDHKVFVRKAKPVEN
ncbi:MAG: hypothetical protein ACT4O9_09350 [Blastocatellia bacterium]